MAVQSLRSSKIIKAAFFLTALYQTSCRFRVKVDGEKPSNGALTSPVHPRTEGCFFSDSYLFFFILCVRKGFRAAFEKIPRSYPEDLGLVHRTQILFVLLPHNHSAFPSKHGRGGEAPRSNDGFALHLEKKLNQYSKDEWDR
ncbi:hypothetical protein TNCT_523271 [Trichonephila clavata]|uniref:Uncharacterized protein n=1 Tax=Trichonephila clavata TaxID=2740835 RepID=A0A8X6JDF5_TRICU|nr:hypothetical protein TNCT_523271 [Trichonephila clavata]